MEIVYLKLQANWMLAKLKFDTSEPRSQLVTIKRRMY